MPLLTDNQITTGFVREERPIFKLFFEEPLPKMAQSYAKGISSITGIPVEKIKKSEPFLKYKDALIR
ncbi:unnamed protein product [marine sediment metagenome]|uniref:Uncharacterized protein n=1 Tax=marine sediment metagenome TaxID=412755 RepID=X1GR12_9ZZZZ